jgi:hypothetical protein
MAHKPHPKAVYAKDMIPGIIYVSIPIGEFLVDDNGKYWWRRLESHPTKIFTMEVSEVNPEPNSLFYVIDDIALVYKHRT